MPAGGAAAAVHGIASRSPSTSVILLAASGVAPDGLETEITGCIAKGSPVCELVDSVKQARRVRKLDRGGFAGEPCTSPGGVISGFGRLWVPETQFGVVTGQPYIRGSGLRGRRVVGRGQGRERASILVRVDLVAAG